MISSQLKHVLTIGKKLVKQQYLLHMSPQNGSLTAEIGLGVWGTPANFNGFRVLPSLLQRRRSPEANQILHDVWSSPALVHYTMSQKVHTFKLSVTLSHLSRFSFFALLKRVWNLLRNPYDTSHLTLGMLLHYLGKLVIQIFCRCGRKRKQIAFLIASISPYWLQIKFFMSLFLLVYFCDQFVAPKLFRHSRRHCSVCQHSTWYSVTRTRFW